MGSWVKNFRRDKTVSYNIRTSQAWPKELRMYDSKKLAQLRQSLERWEETSLQKTLNKYPERQDEYITTSSEPINRQGVDPP